MDRVATEVCIVGAGPAGLVLAQRLLAAKVPCILLERESTGAAAARVKAGMLEHRVVRALERHGLAQPILEHGSTNGTVEIRAGGKSYEFDYGKLTGGRGHFVYPQHLLVQAWADAFQSRGGDLRFSTRVTALEASEGAAARVFAEGSNGQRVRVDCHAVVVAAGAGSTLTPGHIISHERSYPFRWLTVMLAAQPLGERTIYVPHERGFAAHLRRSEALTRYYLQIPAHEGHAEWGDARLLGELELRFRLNDGVAPRIAGEVLERDILDLRVGVREPLQAGCVYLVGDAAHLITPAGGKGMNLAIGDALELAEGLISHFRDGDGERLDRYSETRLPAIWRAQEFSDWMLSVHCGGGQPPSQAAAGAEAGFSAGLHRARVERLFTDPAFARWFAHSYAGVDAS